MNMTELNPFVRYIDKREEFYTGKLGNYAYDYRLFYISKGSTVLYVDGVPHILKCNEMAIVPPGTLYRCNEGENAGVFVINMDLRFENTDKPMILPSGINSFEKEKILSKTTCELIPVILKCNGDGTEILEKVLKLYIEKPKYYLDRMSALLKTLILESMEYTDVDNVPELVTDIKHYIEEKYAENIDNNVVGKRFSYHPNYINRVFKGATGQTVHGYLSEIRLKKAMEMILKSDSNVYIIYKMCGFSSYAYFIKCFRKRYGVSPLKYRKQRKNV